MRRGVLRRGHRPAGGGEPDQGAGQGRAQDHVQDGRVHRGLLHRGADLRGGRPRPGGDRHLLHRDHVPAGRRRIRRAGRRRPRRGTAGPVPSRGARTRHRRLETGGDYQWRREGEPHLFSPETVFKLQHATRTRRYEIFTRVHPAGRRPVRPADDAARPVAHPRRRSGRCRGTADPRGLGAASHPARVPIPVDEVEPVSTIVRRFSTGAMSYGSISAEAHETLAIAMNRLGGRSNTGEGGEDPDRFVPDANGDLRRSAVKQVASGRFGVTSEYLVNADDLQIKMAQGAKPGEGGQLPGHKVYPWIAKTRYSTPGRRADLAAAAPRHLLDRGPGPADPRPEERQPARPGCTSSWSPRSGVGTVAAGVSKAHADVVLISGHDGGTGAAPLTSIKHAGAPWELGLAETQQTLLRNGLRDRIVVQVDGQLKTGRDVIIAALLGAEEFGFATAPLVVSGCVHDAGLPPGHLPGRGGHPEPGAAPAVHRQAGVRGQLLRVHRRGGPRVPGRARASARWTRRSAGSSCWTPGGRRPLEGGRAGPHAGAARARRCPPARPGTASPARTTGSTGRWTTR